MNTQEAALVWTSLPYNFGIQEGYEYLRENWNRIFALYRHDKHLIKSIIVSQLSKLTTKNELDRVRIAFF